MPEGLPRTRVVPAPSLPASPSRRGLLARLAGLASGGLLVGGASRAFAAPTDVQSAQPYIGELAIVPFTFAPLGWLMCDGQIVSIAQYETLFFLVGTTYGGDGMTTYGIPDLRGRLPMHMSAQRPIGTMGGEASTTLFTTHLPGHTHGMVADGNVGTSAQPSGMMLARDPAGVPTFGNGGSPAALALGAVAPSGGGQPHDNMPPYLGLNFIIAYEGIFPSPA